MILGTELPRGKTFFALIGLPASYTLAVTRFLLACFLSGPRLSAATIDVDQQIFLWPYLTLGAATAGNTVTMQMAKLYGEN